MDLLSQQGMWTCDQGAIRISQSGQPSVFDMIKVLGGQKNPRDAWQRLSEAHPEVVGKCDNLRLSQKRTTSDSPVQASARLSDEAWNEFDLNL